MTKFTVAIKSGLLVAIGVILAAIGLVGCTILSAAPSGTYSADQYPVFIALAITGVAIVVAGSFVEPGRR